MSGDTTLTDLPIFPLGTVLFPGGVLPLRVFEARYMDMVRGCLQADTPFGVCLITRGREVGEAAEHEPIGCLARVESWDMEQLGVLQIRTRGGERFEVLERRIQADGLIRATVRLLPEDPDAPIGEGFAILAQLVQRIVEDLAEREPDPARRMVAEPHRFDSSVWVSNRLCEFLPIPMGVRQKLMALPDPQARLSLARQFLAQRQVI